MAHRLDPLLNPRSIAVVGATVREGSVGNRTIRNLLTGGYRGRLYAINPAYQDVVGVPCYPELDALSEPVEHVIFTLGDAHIEAAIDAAISHGASAATIMSALVLENDSNPPLADRIRAKLRESGLLVCGSNSMGFYNFPRRLWVCGFDTRTHQQEGNVALISHSGSGMSGIVDVEGRIDFNLAISAGRETIVTIDEYLDYALEQPETEVIGLFIETARNPEGLIAAFEKAAAKGIPIVAIKVGRTELAARLTLSHCGAMAGQDRTFDAIFDRYGVQRVADMDELATALIMFAQPHLVAGGALVSVHDSGGERELCIDLADQYDVPFAELSDSTTRRLDELLDPGLPAINPLDAWSAGGPDYQQRIAECLAAMMSDPAAAVGAVIHDRNAHSSIEPAYADYLRRGHEASGKPAFLVSPRQGTGSDPLAVSLTREGFPVLDGLIPFLKGIRCLFDYRDFRQRGTITPPKVRKDLASRWRRRISGRGRLDEANSAALLADFGLPMNHGKIVDNENSAVAAARSMGFPVVLKTAAEGIAHKTNSGGVKLDLADQQAVREAYRSLAESLGNAVLVAPMIEPGVEMILGVIKDRQFGPVVMLGFGGIHAEILHDVVFAIPPFDADTARRLIGKLKMHALLEGQRGKAPADVDSYCEAAARLSALATELGDVIEEIDINPLIVGSRGCVAVDALVVTSTDARRREPDEDKRLLA